VSSGFGRGFSIGWPISSIPDDPFKKFVLDQLSALPES
jgi:hypothetical protein